MRGNIYIAGPMRGYPEFNFPAFRVKSYELRRMGWTVFSPAEKDEEVHGNDFSQKYQTGDEDAAKANGFNLRDALAIDLEYICRNADAIYMLKGWEKSTGAKAEHATAVALGLDIYYE